MSPTKLARGVLATATAAVLVMGVAVPAYAVEPPPMLPSVGSVAAEEPLPSGEQPVETVAPDTELLPPEGEGIDATDPESLEYLLNCRPWLDADMPHISGDGSGELSSHGFWLQGRCRDKRGTIAIHLQAYFNDHIWRSRGIMGFATVLPGGGAGKRATARVQCVSPKPVSWRAWAVIHTPSGGRASKYSVGNTLNCSTDRG